MDTREKEKIWSEMLARSHDPQDWFQGAGDDSWEQDGNNRYPNGIHPRGAKHDPSEAAGVPDRGNAPRPRTREGTVGYVRPTQRTVRTPR